MIEFGSICIKYLLLFACFTCVNEMIKRCLWSFCPSIIPKFSHNLIILMHGIRECVSIFFLIVTLYSWFWDFSRYSWESIRYTPHGKIQNKYKGSIVIHLYRESQAIVGLVNMCNFKKSIWVESAITIIFCSFCQT